MLVGSSSHATTHLFKRKLHLININNINSHPYNII